MSSILKVDQLQDSGGNNIITSNGSGTFTSSLPNTGITMADQWRLSADTNQGTNGTVASNWERIDDSTWSGIGTGLTESSGIFSFNSTGIYLIIYNGTFSVGGADGNCELEFKTTLDNSNYNEDAIVLCGDGSSSLAGTSGVNTFLLDVTNTTNVKFLFRSGSMGGSTVLRGHTDFSYTGFTVLRLGDT